MTGRTRSLLHITTDWPGHFPGGPRIIATLAAAGADPDARGFGQWRAAHRLIEHGRARVTPQDAATLGLLDRVEACLDGPEPPTSDAVTSARHRTLCAPPPPAARIPPGAGSGHRDGRLHMMHTECDHC
ncbi:hypothetical protein [Streptomyces sp. NBC_01236]|uniref:hypothetical protein n=1 Tax=Streptomyces sp. NBC_01236 TaxID=2903789 RepID=UPI002E0F9031|nr:hypothetical protein OG324_40810 [Streptomyces sp. NBC_01236]